jgi:hypothetical protein
MKKILNGEILPRRVSSQYLIIKKKKLSAILKWVDLEKKSNKINKINVEFARRKRKKISISNFIVSVPFPRKIQEKVFHLFLSNTYRKIKKEANSFFLIKSIRKISGLNKFFEDIKSRKNFHQKNINSKIFIIDQKIKNALIDFNNNIFKKILPDIIQIDLKNDISVEIIKNLAICKTSDLNLTTFLIKIPKNVCLKSLRNNIINLIGGVLEKIPSGNNLIQKISIKTQILPKTHIYLQN